jgi:hypothetical protein
MDIRIVRYFDGEVLMALADVGHHDKIEKGTRNQDKKR